MPLSSEARAAAVAGLRIMRGYNRTRKGFLAGGSVTTVERAGQKSVSVCMPQRCEAAATREERSGFAPLQCRMGKERWLGVLAGAYPGEHGPEKALL